MPYKLPVATLTAALIFAALVSSASARSLSTSNQSLAATFRSVEFNMPFGGTICALSLSGSLHTRTIAKVAGALIGYINRAVLGACSSGSYTVLTETLPWHVTYRHFTGVLPTITSIGTNVIGWSERIREPAFITCLWRSTTAAPVVINYFVGRGVITTAAISGTIPTDCGIEGTFHSEAGPVATTAGGATRITVTLI